MLWHKRTTHKFPLVIFGLVALGIIISGTILLVELFKERAVIEQTNITLPEKENNLKILHTSTCIFYFLAGALIFFIIKK